MKSSAGVILSVDCLHNKNFSIFHFGSGRFHSTFYCTLADMVNLELLWEEKCG